MLNDKFPKLALNGFDNNTFVGSHAKKLNGEISVKRGIHNYVSIGLQARFSGDIHIYGSNNLVSVEDGADIVGRILVKGDGQRVVIGKETTSKGIYILCQEGCDVEIGSHCMFSRNIEIRTSDAHSVIDRTTGKRLNTPSSIHIGDHVWVGVGAIINKGSSIPRDSIVGALSFVNKAFQDEGVVLAGTPARVVKTGISWNRKAKDSFTQSEMNFWKDE